MYYQVARVIQYKSITIFLVSWGEVRLSPLGTSATIWLIVPALNER
jgi:hypothetical protein